MDNKRGISAVVATVLIILITVAAVTIIWAAIIPMIKEQTVGGTICLDAVSQVSVESQGGYTCWEAGTAAVAGSCSESLDASGETCIQDADNCATTCSSITDGTADGDWTDAIPAGAGSVKVQVSRGAADFDLAGVQIIISEAGDTTSTEVSTGLPGVNEERVITVPYTATGTGPDKVEIAPIVTIGNTQRTCEVSASASLSAC